MSPLHSCFRPLLLAGLIGAASGAEARFRGGPARVTLLELYTSEGCSSCPPAEKWLGELRHAPGLWRDFVPVAFHVNYWDHLGWRDALATRAFTDRQHAYAAAWRANLVYTPGFVRNGAEWRPRDAPALDATGGNAGTLEIRWRPADNTCVVDFRPSPTVAGGLVAGPFAVSVALLGGGIVHAIRRGENSGRELRHEFVALRLETASLRPGADGTAAGALTATLTLPPNPDIAVTRRALAAWVTRRGDLSPLQAAGGWIE